MLPTQLRGEWLQTYKSAAPAIGPTLLALGIAHRLQEKAFGGLPGVHARELARLGTKYAKSGDVGAHVAATFKVGTRLVRDWQGESHHVLICDDGYRYRDHHYRSLSEIARVITGAHWSGPRFFGLKTRRQPCAVGEG
jgi:hypothetical protein